MNQLNSYQTVPLPDGTIIPGAFPTIEWFKKIKEYISFKNTWVLDLGCCQFSYGIQALEDDAQFVLGIDSDPLRIEQSKENIDRWFLNSKSARVEQKDLEEILKTANTNSETFDIVIMSMIIHWLKDPINSIKQAWKLTNSYLVIIYRVPQVGLEEIGYRPTLQQLNNIIGQRPYKIHHLSRTKEQNIALVIYGKDL